MLLTRVRLRPWRALLWRSSSGRLTSRTPSPFSIVIGLARVWLRVPLGPFTVTTGPSIATSTLDGTAIGSLPIRDMSITPSQFSSSPDVGEDFPTHALLVRLSVGQQALARRDDRDTQAAEHLRETRVLGVDPQARLADPANARDGALPVTAVLQGDGQRLADLALGRLLHVVRRDVALLLEDVLNALLELAVRHGNRVVVRLVGVAQTGEHVCDRVSHRHGREALSPPWFRTCISGATCSDRWLVEKFWFTKRTWSRRAARRGAPSPAGRCGTGRTCGRRPWAGRNAGSGCSRGQRTSACGRP